MKQEGEFLVGYQSRLTIVIGIKPIIRNNRIRNISTTALFIFCFCLDFSVSHTHNPTRTIHVDIPVRYRCLFKLFSNPTMSSCSGLKHNTF